MNREKILSGFDNSPLFFGVYSILKFFYSITGPGFDLGKNNSFPFPGNYINFPLAGPKIPGDYGHSRRFQKRRRPVLPPFSGAGIRHIFW
jgi:hypothetical protein